jgi:hypothetical protein
MHDAAFVLCPVATLPADVPGLYPSLRMPIRRRVVFLDDAVVGVRVKS